MRALHDCPAGASIAYAFVTPQEAAYLLQKTDLLGARPSPTYCWRDLNGRRSMSWGTSVSLVLLLTRLARREHQRDLVPPPDSVSGLYGRQLATPARAYYDCYSWDRPR